MVLKLELLGKQSNVRSAQKADIFCGNNFIIATFLWSFTTNEGDFLVVSGISQPTWRGFTGSSSMSCRLVPWPWQWLLLPPGYSVMATLQRCFQSALLGAACGI